MKANLISEQAEQTAKQLEQTFRQTAEDLSDSAQKLTKKGMKTARKVGAAADVYLHANAWKTVAMVALAVGVVGYLVGRSRD